jgi:large subunit ribosomal protein L32
MLNIEGDTMPHPKRRQSKTRRDKRRTHDFLTPVNTVDCPNCGEKMLPHRICDYCGFYKKTQYIEKPSE